jgi:hypothetical protein
MGFATEHSNRKELARLTLPSFSDRFTVNEEDFKLAFTKRIEDFIFVSSGTASFFTIFFARDNFTAYNGDIANNSGSCLISGSVGIEGSNADLILSQLNIIDSNIVIKDFDFKLISTTLQRFWLSADLPEGNIRLPLYNILDQTTTGWKSFARSGAGKTVSDVEWLSLWNNLTTGIKIMGDDGRVAFLSVDKLKPSGVDDLTKTIKTPANYDWTNNSASNYFYHHEIVGNNAAGGDYSILCLTSNANGGIWNESNRFAFMNYTNPNNGITYAGKPNWPFTLYIH